MRKKKEKPSEEQPAENQIQQPPTAPPAPEPAAEETTGTGTQSQGDAPADPESTADAPLPVENAATDSEAADDAAQPEGDSASNVPAQPIENAAPHAPAKWRRVTRDVDVTFDLDDEEKARLGQKLADTVVDIRALEARKDASAKSYAGQIKEAKSHLEELSDAFTNGRHTRSVGCEWLFQQAGYDATGAAVYDPDKKTLVQTDSPHTVVRIEPISDEDWNQYRELPIGDGAPPELTEEADEEGALDGLQDEEEAGRSVDASDDRAPGQTELKLVDADALDEDEDETQEAEALAQA